MNTSKISSNFLGQPMFQLMQKINKKKNSKEIIHLEIGEPDFNTPSNIKKAAIKGIVNNHTHYVSSYGMESFRNSIIETTSKTRGFKPQLDQILITPGGNSIIYFLIKSLCNPSDEILIPNPGFPTYISAAKANNVKYKFYHLSINNDYQIDLDEIKKKITDKTRLLIINSPSNPLGVTFKKKELIKIFKFCKKNNIFILSDEIYSRLVFNNENFFSMSSLDKCKKNVIVLNGFSKAFAMTGWRLGVCIGPKFLIEKMNILQETIVSCVPPFIQLAGIEAIKGSQNEVKKMIKIYEKKRDILISELFDKSNNFKLVKPTGSLYAFPDISMTGLNGQIFSDICLEKLKIGVLPGKFFGTNGNNCIRICFANSEKNLEIASKKIYNYFK